jgi:PAS domain S-box-containing protein
MEEAADSGHCQLSSNSFARGRPPDGRIKTIAFAVLRSTTNSHFVTWRALHHYGCLRTREPFIRRVFDLVRSSTSSAGVLSEDLVEHSDRYLASLTVEGRYRLLVEAVTDYAIFMLNASGIVTSWNPGAERLKGYLATEIIGQHFSRFYTPEDQETGLPARALETARREGKFEAEGWRVRKDGSRFWAYVVIDPIRGPSGELIGFAKITRDLSERKAVEQKLEKAREISLQSQKLEAIGQLTGGIAHDFNNLLTAILGSLELLRKRLPNDRRSISLLENAAQGAERGKTLTNRMLAFARNQELKHEVVDVPELVQGMTELLQRSLGSTFKIETRFPLGLKRVMSDANQLEMALLNLAVNRIVRRSRVPSKGQGRFLSQHPWS